MKRPSAINTKVLENSSDLLPNTAPSSSQTFIEEPVSPSNNNDNGNISDTDSVSDSSRLRKKRNTYQKISDDIRVNLLEAVQNGETLKAAAKRHKINYSSAKSILHTYRKEGRILKKSAQERTMKRKGETSPDYSEDPKPVKQCKKENVQPTSTDSKTSKPANLLAEKKKPLAQSASNTQNENAPATKIAKAAITPSSKANQDENSYKAPTEATKPQAAQQPAQNQEESTTSKTLPEGNHGDHTEMNNTGNMDNHHMPTHRTKRFDSFQAFMGAHFPEHGTDHSDSHHNMFNDPFSDMMHSMQNRAFPHDDIHHNSTYFFPPGFGASSALEDKTSKVENGMNFEDFHFGGFADCPLKSFMDTQNLFREALRKASFFSQGGPSGVRKDSIDFFKM